MLRDIVNLTTHDVKVYRKNGQVNNYKPCKFLPPLRADDGIEILNNEDELITGVMSEYPKIVGPSLEEIYKKVSKGSIIVVSKITLRALQINSWLDYIDTFGIDLIFACPDTVNSAIKDENGKIIGVTGFLTLEVGKSF